MGKLAHCGSRHCGRSSDSDLHTLLVLLVHSGPLAALPGTCNSVAAAPSFHLGRSSSCLGRPRDAPAPGRAGAPRYGARPGPGASALGHMPRPTDLKGHHTQRHPSRPCSARAAGAPGPGGAACHCQWTLRALEVHNDDRDVAHGPGLIQVGVHRGHWPVVGNWTATLKVRGATTPHEAH